MSPFFAAIWFSLSLKKNGLSIKELDYQSKIEIITTKIIDLLGKFHGIDGLLQIILLLSMSSIAVCGPILFTSISGEITSPNFPADYLNAVYCRYTIERSYRGPTLLRHTHFFLGTNDNCTNNYVRVSISISILSHWPLGNLNEILYM